MNCLSIEGRITFLKMKLKTIRYSTRYNTRAASLYNTSVMQFTTIEQINGFINKTYCPDASAKLTDLSLKRAYLKTPSCVKRISFLQENLEKLGIPKNFIQTILQSDAIVNELCIPPGTKGAIRGNEFNRIVKDVVTNIVKSFHDKDDYTLKFEEKFRDSTHEIPDWYIYNKKMDKVLIGMNQIDLWTGGQQTNRGSKYVLNDEFHNSDNQKIVSVVCKYHKLHSKNNKAYHIFHKGFQNDRLCYIGNLHNIINSFFKT